MVYFIFLTDKVSALNCGKPKPHAVRNITELKLHAAYSEEFIGMLHRKFLSSVYVKLGPTSAFNCCHSNVFHY
jgi:hypothetical protein